MSKVARATAGFTGADLMNLMNTSAVLAVRTGEQIISEATIFQVSAGLHSRLELFDWCCLAIAELDQNPTLPISKAVLPT